MNTDIPASLQQGIFKPGNEYKAWVRLSNGGGEIKPDSEKDGRGMAIKLIGVPGLPLLPGQVNAKGEATMDILMINHPQFFIRNAHDYVGFAKAAPGGELSTLAWFLSPFNPHWTEFGVANKIRGKTPSSPLGMQYWSMTPSQLGPDYAPMAVKYSAAPCGGEKAPLAKEYLKSMPNSLRAALVSEINAGPACYDFYVQPQADAVKTPVEDPVVLWPDSGKSALQKVARLTFPANQKFDTEEQLEFCENLSMTPWHASAEHRPLGGIQRVRKVVYETVSTVRHDLNLADRKEPTGEEFPLN